MQSPAPPPLAPPPPPPLDPRSWHLWEKHISVGGHPVPGERRPPPGAPAACASPSACPGRQMACTPSPCMLEHASRWPRAHSLVPLTTCPLFAVLALPLVRAGSIFDFALYFFHNAKELLNRGSGPYFYLVGTAAAAAAGTGGTTACSSPLEVSCHLINCTIFHVPGIDRHNTDSSPHRHPAASTLGTAAQDAGKRGWWGPGEQGTVCEGAARPWLQRLPWQLRRLGSRGPLFSQPRTAPSRPL